MDRLAGNSFVIQINSFRRFLLPLLLLVMSMVGFSTMVEAEEFSRGFLGIYRKVMEIEDPILRYSEKYGLKPELSKAICLYESGGNANLTSWAGAEGYFQVMPRTFRHLKVKTNIEAGIKYLAQQYREFKREDYAVAAYNGGPANIHRKRSLRLETVQYVIGVGDFRSLLMNDEAEIRARASRLKLYTVKDGQTWWDISHQLDIPVIELRMYNPFLAHRTLRSGNLIAYPETSEGIDALFTVDGKDVKYTALPGDNYFHLAFIFDADLEEFRDLNSIWRVQTIRPGTPLIIQPHRAKEVIQYTLKSGDSIPALAARYKTSPWSLIRENRLWYQTTLQPGTVMNVPREPKPPKYTTYRVKRGDTLQRIARRFGVSVRAIQTANGMSRKNTRIYAGKTLRIPRK